jgi:hypothetical protein
MATSNICPMEKVSYSSLPLGDVRDVSLVPGGLLRPQRSAISTPDKIEHLTPFYLSAPAKVVRARLMDVLPLPKS